MAKLEIDALGARQTAEDITLDKAALDLKSVQTANLDQFVIALINKLTPLLTVESRDQDSDRRVVVSKSNPQIYSANSDQLVKRYHWNLFVYEDYVETEVDPKHFE